MSHEQRVAETLQRNREIISERGPGLYYDIKACVLAKDTVKGQVLLGGLGGLGCGEMWMSDERYVGTPEYDDAPDLPGQAAPFYKQPTYEWPEEPDE